MANKISLGPRFTGGDYLKPTDGFTYYLYQSMMMNELLGGLGAYTLTSPGSKYSGYSFGPQQLDIAGGNPIAPEVMRRILENATDASGNYIFTATQADSYKQQAQLIDESYCESHYKNC